MHGAFSLMLFEHLLRSFSRCDEGFDPVVAFLTTLSAFQPTRSTRERDYERSNDIKLKRLRLSACNDQSMSCRLRLDGDGKEWKPLGLLGRSLIPGKASEDNRSLLRSMKVSSDAVCAFPVPIH